METSIYTSSVPENNVCTKKSLNLIKLCYENNIHGEFDTGKWI